MHWRISFHMLGVATVSGRILVQPSTLEIDIRGSLGIFGPSGSGKTLLARAIIDVMPPGLVRLGPPAALVRLDRGASSPILPERIQMIPQSPASALPPAVSCGAFLDSVLRWPGHCKHRERRSRAMQILQMVNLPPTDVMPLHASQLSGGMAQRFALALAIANSAEVIILDEPTIGLDEKAKGAVLEAIQNLTCAGRKFVIVSHDPSIKDLAKTFIQVDRGEYDQWRSNEIYER